jgi:LmbE family N-acetylglucosaminyl deacetylase
MDRVIVFAPHQDDETLACGGTMAKRIDQGYEVSVVYMTDGRYGLPDISSEPSPEELVKIREEEAINAMGVLGVKSSNLFFLRNEDTKLEICKCEAERNVIKILKRICPNEVYFPSESDFHKDHLATNKIIEDALVKLDYFPNEYKYNIHNKHYAINVVNEYVINFTKHRFTYVDVSRYLHLKTMALTQYKSQFSIISTQQKDPPLGHSFLNVFLRRKEKFLTFSARSCVTVPKK